MTNPGNAEPQLGTLGTNEQARVGTRRSQAHRGWYSRGYLPHADFPGLMQMITYRLADSLPAGVLNRIRDELHSTPTNQQEVEKRRLIERWLDAGQGSCALRQPGDAECVVRTWQRFAGERYGLLAWVVMPNHVHVLVRVCDGATLGKIVQSWKSYTGRRMAELGLGDPRDGDPRGGVSGGGGTGTSVWMRDYWDRSIRDERHLSAAVEYIHNNPVKAGLVKNPEDWPWSSAPSWGSAFPGSEP